MKVKAKKLAGLLGRALFALPTAGLLSCSLVREDIAECPNPEIEIRFMYDYNMEYANAFHNQVDCLSVYFFDADGHLVDIERVTNRDSLADENYRMKPLLPDGNYHVVAYGGMECENASFAPHNLATGAHLTDLNVHLNPNCLTDTTRFRLHNHYYGSGDFTVDNKADSRATVYMMRNTNSVQIALQHLNGSPIDVNDFIFEITDDNNDFDYANNLLATGEIKYNPWNTENRSTGTVDSDTTLDSNAAESSTQEWHTALAQFTTSRMVARKQTSATLHVRRAEDGDTVFRIPIINYMLLFKHNNSGAGLEQMSDQEYLDRENSWNFVFFLDETKDNMWINTRLIINDWEVRLNNTDF